MPPPPVVIGLTINYDEDAKELQKDLDKLVEWEAKIKLFCSSLSFASIDYLRIMDREIFKKQMDRDRDIRIKVLTI